MAVMRYLVADVNRAVDFYTTRLGFTVTQSFGAAFAAVALDDLTLWLSGPASSAARPMPDGRQPEPGGWNRVVVQVPDLPSRVAGLRAIGAHFRNDIVTGPGGKQILLEDGEGNLVELFETA